MNDKDFDDKDYDIFLKKEIDFLEKQKMKLKKELDKQKDEMITTKPIKKKSFWEKLAKIF